MPLFMPVFMPLFMSLFMPLFMPVFMLPAGAMMLRALRASQAWDL
jgi:hypothetical protein